ncbi:MAG: hypothetical protein Q8T08_22045, partial [Ignavibacteria bacterium]|nr:hypothetical protein [Ignavibacteria bacterium]
MDISNNLASITCLLQELELYCDQFLGKEYFRKWYMTHVPLKFASLSSPSDDMLLKRSEYVFKTFIQKHEGVQDFQPSLLKSILSNVKLSNQEINANWNYHPV